MKTSKLASPLTLETETIGPSVLAKYFCEQNQNSWNYAHWYQSSRLRLSLIRRLLQPSLADVFLLAIFFWLFVFGAGWHVLLADGDTGLHIRAGQILLSQRQLFSTDPFSVGTAGSHWFAWEWLAEVLFALLATSGLKGVVFFTGIAIAISATVMLRHSLWRGASPFVALPICFLAVGASTIHYLARPHVFTLLLFPICMWIIDADLRQRSRLLWTLPVLTALWTNVHGGFAGLIATLAVLDTGLIVQYALGQTSKTTVWRYLSVSALCGVATLANPYGLQLHAHVIQYLRSDWILNAVDEFQSPKFRSEGMLQFEILLFLALGVCTLLLRSRSWPMGLVAIFWAHQALTSVRHVPLFCIIAAPLVAAELSRVFRSLTEKVSRRSIAGVIRDFDSDIRPQLIRNSTIPGLVCGLLFLWPTLRWPADFPENKFPVHVIAAGALQEAFHQGRPVHVFTTDQWGDYLLFRLHPEVRTFVDGRSDFLGPVRGREYLQILEAQPGWEGVVQTHKFDAMLVPADAPVRPVLENSPSWSLKYADTQASLFLRRDIQATSPGQTRD